jgi:hypothetical protein
MADVFISYAREDRECARVLAETLEQHGLTVWWDHELYAGQPFGQVIEREIANARAALVMWSSSSVASEYVTAEAARARELKKLLPVRIDNTWLPVPFNTIHTTDLSRWLAPSKSGGRVRGDSEAANQATTSLLRDLKHYRGGPPSGEVQEPAAPARAIEFRWDARQHTKSYDKFGIVEDDDWVVVKMPPQLRDDVSGTRTVVKKGLVARKPNFE